MPIPQKKTILLALLLGVFAVAALAAYYVRNLDLDTYREEIAREVSTALDRRVVYERGDFRMAPIPSFTFTNVRIAEKDGTSEFLSASKLRFRIAILPLLRKKVVLSGIALESPQLKLVRYPSGEFNVSDLAQAKEGSVSLHAHEISVHGGTIDFIDHAAEPAGLATTLRELELRLDETTRGKNCRIKLEGVISHAGRNAPITMSGTVRLSKSGTPLSESQAKLAISLHGANMAHFWPYYGTYVGFRKPGGVVDVDGELNGSLLHFTSKGKIGVHNLSFTYPGVFNETLTPKEVTLRYGMSLEPDEVAVRELDLRVDRLTVKGSCTIGKIRSGDPTIDASASTSPFRFEEFRSYVPYGIIPSHTSDYIREHIKGGTFQLLKGTLKGAASRIAHMERERNYEVLNIFGTVENGIVGYGPAVPPLHNIRGNIELSGKDFSLKGMSGLFGGSPFTLDGKLREYCTNAPTTYPFSLAISPRPEESAWLGEKILGKMNFSGNSDLKLNGEGIYENYEMWGEWDLTPASFIVGKWGAKPKNLPTALKFHGRIADGKVSVRELGLRAGSISANASGTVSVTGKPHINFTVATTPFPAEEAPALLPMLKRYEPRGRVQLRLQGKGTMEQPENIALEGELKFNDLSVRPAEKLDPLTHLTGSADFSGSKVETSLLQARLGGSNLFGKVIAYHGPSPSLTVAFSSPALDVADIGFASPDRKRVVLTGLQGNLSAEKGIVRIRSASARINRTSLNVKGTVLLEGRPSFEISSTGSFMDLDDIVLLGGLQAVRWGGDGQTPKLTATVMADSGAWEDLTFEKLTMRAIYDRTLLLEDVSFSSFGGKATGSAKIDLSAVPRYEIKGNLEKANADRVMQALGVKKQEVRGSVSMQGEVTAQGSDKNEFLRTLSGNLSVHFREGSLKRFSVLSKIFSILNVAQILKFQLPDMVSGGMPYNSIKGTISFHGGVASTTDLFLKSDAMNMSAVGSVNMLKQDVKMNVGVQPLQTVDKIVNRIPIVGWILTGKDRNFITSYFEVRGPLADPSVSAIPVSSLGKGVLDIFIRVFQLPGKLITDTGEVIIGK